MDGEIKKLEAQNIALRRALTAVVKDKIMLKVCESRFLYTLTLLSKLSRLIILQNIFIGTKWRGQEILRSFAVRENVTYLSWNFTDDYV